MNTVINSRLISGRASEILTDLVKTNPICTPVEFNSANGIALIDSRRKKLIKYVLNKIGGRFPLALVVLANTNDELIVKKVYNTLSETDKRYAEVVTESVGARISVYVDHYRDDILEKFWNALYPDGTDTRRSRTRWSEKMSVKIPDELQDVVLQMSDWSQIVAAEDGLYTTEVFLKTLQNEKRRQITKQKMKLPRPAKLNSRTA